MKKKIKNNTKTALPKSAKVAKLLGVREIVVKQMKSLELTAYKLAKITGIPEQTIYNFQTAKTNMQSDKLEKLLVALGLKLVVG